MWSCPKLQLNQTFFCSSPAARSKAASTLTRSRGVEAKLKRRAAACCTTRLVVFQNQNPANPNPGAQATRPSSKTASDTGRRPTSRAPSGAQAVARRRPVGRAASLPAAARAHGSAAASRRPAAPRRTTDRRTAGGNRNHRAS